MLKRILQVIPLVILAVPAFAQGFRIGDNAPVSSSLTAPGVISTLQATINVCGSPANAVPCTNKSQTYTSVTLGTPCSTSTQVVLAGTTTCVAQSDARGNWGAWVAAGNYDFTITLSTGQSFGPFTLSVGIPSGSSISPGTVTSSSANPAATGFIRAASGDIVCWRNNANTADVCATHFTDDSVRFDQFSAIGIPNNLTFKTAGGFNVSIVALNPGISRTFTIPDLGAGANFIGDITAQTVTNKTVACTSNTLTGVPCQVYNTVSASTNASIGTTTMATAGGSGNTYRFTAFIDVTALGTSCSTSTQLLVSVISTDPNAGGTSTAFPPGFSTTINSPNYLAQTFNLTPTANNGVIPTGVSVGPMLIRAKANTAVQYSTTYTAGTGCAPGPSYQLYPILEQM